MAVSFKKVLQDLVMPEIQAIKGEVISLRTEIHRLDEKIDSGFKRQDEKTDSLRHELLAEIRRVDERLDGLDKRIETAIDLHERIAFIEAKLAIKR